MAEDPRLEQFCALARAQGLDAVLAIYDGDELVGSVNLAAARYVGRVHEAVSLGCRVLRDRASEMESAASGSKERGDD
jgi:hypothetical protein